MEKVKKTEAVTRIVRLGAFARRYHKGEVFMAVPYEDSSIDNFITGQELSEENPNGLTRAQITGEEPLTAVQKREYPYVIKIDLDKFRGIPLSRETKFNLSINEAGKKVNPKDHAIYTFVTKAYGDIIAPSKEKAIVDKHLFFLVDDVRDATERNKNRKLRREVETKVFDNLGTESYYELILFVNYHAGTNYSVSKNRSEAMIVDDVYDVISKHPNIIDRMFTDEGAQELSILKMVHHNIIKRRQGAFSTASDQYISDSIKGVITYMTKPSNNVITASWQAQLEKADVRYAEYLKALKETNKDK